MIPPFLADVPVIGLLRNVAPAVAVKAAGAATRGGIRALEVTLNSEEPFALIRSLRQALPDIAIGAGTVMSVDALERALEAGAQFVVCPHLDTAIVRACVERQAPVFPGAMTPTEVWQAWDSGATMVKLFPAGVLGPEYIRALRGPLPQVDLLVTGGIDASNLASFLAAGAKGAAVGGRLFPAELPDVAVVERAARALVEACRRG